MSTEHFKTSSRTLRLRASAALKTQVGHAVAPAQFTAETAKRLRHAIPESKAAHADLSIFEPARPGAYRTVPQRVGHKRDAVFRYRRYTGAKLERFRLYLSEDGRLCFRNSKTGELERLDTRGNTESQLPLCEPVTNRALFVMQGDGSLYSSMNVTTGVRYRLKHPSFSDRQPVAAAGELEVHDGLLVYVNNNSGHYQPPPELLSQFIRELEKQGADLSALRQEVHGA